MDDGKKKKEDKPNKAFYPASNKRDVPEVPKVRIKMKPGRAAEGVTVDKDGYATVDARLAAHLVKINYADMAEEK